MRCACSSIILANVRLSSAINNTLSPGLISVLSSPISSTKNKSISDLLNFSEGNDLIRPFTSVSSSTSISSISEISTYCKGRNSVNLLPIFVSLSSSILPPNKSESPRLIDNPKPVPPYLRLVEPSACWKASNMMFCFSLEIPIPVSEISKATTASALSRLRLAVFQLLLALYIFNCTSPFSVNLKEFDSKFFKI
ncbi:hypothetical protein D3C84_826570 [compost metagenome]